MSDATKSSEIWRKALCDYRANTNRDLLERMALSNLHTLGDLFAKLDTQENEFKAWLGNKKQLRAVLKASMEPVKALGEVAQVILQGSPYPYAAAIFTATSYLIKSAKGVSEGYASIIELLKRLADFSERLNEYAKYDIDDKLWEKITDILSTMLDILAKSEKAMVRGRVKEWARVAFLGNDGGVADAVARLQLQVESEGRYVAAKTFSTTQKLDKDINGISSSLIGMEECNTKALLPY